MHERSSLLMKPEFPRSAKYDPDWMMDNQMGPNALWLMEWLCEALDRDRGRYLGFIRLTARRTDAAGEDLYDPALGAMVGVDK